MLMRNRKLSKQHNNKPFAREVKRERGNGKSEESCEASATRQRFAKDVKSTILT